MISKVKSSQESVKQFTLRTVIGDMLVFISSRTVIGLMRPNDVELYLDKLDGLRPQPVVDVSFCSDLDAMETALRVREALGRILGKVPDFMKYVYTFAGQDSNAVIYADKRPAAEYIAEPCTAAFTALDAIDDRIFIELPHLIPKVDCIPLAGEALGQIQNSLLSAYSGRRPQLISYTDLACLSHPELPAEQGAKYTRSAATAMAKNPVLLLVPCHMVISKPLFDEYNKLLANDPEAQLKDAGKYRLGADIKACLMRRYGVNIKLPD